MTVVWPDIDAATLRQMLDAGICPECGEGAFASLGGHFVKAHGIGVAAVKDQALIPKHSSLMSPEATERMRRAAKLRYRGQLQKPEAMENAKATPRKLSTYGRMVQAEKAKQMRARHGGTQAHMRTMSKTRVEKLARANTERDARILELYKQGDLLLEEIGAESSCHQVTVSKVLDDAGFDAAHRLSHRNQIWMKRHPERLDRAMEVGRAIRDEASRVTLERRAMRFQVLGADWGALVALADEENVDRQNLRGYLVANGVAVPDGRAVSPLRGQWKRPKHVPKPCAECSRDAVARGLCRMHYQRMRKRVAL